MRLLLTSNGFPKENKNIRKELNDGQAITVDGINTKIIES